MSTPRQSRDPRQAMLLSEEPLPGATKRKPFIAVAPDNLAHSLVEVASGIFGLINRDDIPSDLAELIDDWRMDYATVYIPSRLASTEATEEIPVVPALAGPFLNPPTADEKPPSAVHCSRCGRNRWTDPGVLTGIALLTLIIVKIVWNLW